MNIKYNATTIAPGGISFSLAMELCTRYTAKQGDTRKRGRRAVHLDRTYIGGRKREALSRSRAASV